MHEEGCFFSVSSVLVVQKVARKFCKYHPSKRCFHDSCDFLDSLGRVRVCRFHPNPYGRFLFRKSKVVLEK